MPDTNSEYSAEARRLANKMWYQNPQNREWKKKYNSNYYRANLGKWSIYAKNAKARLKTRIKIMKKQLAMPLVLDDVLGFLAKIAVLQKKLAAALGNQDRVLMRQGLNMKQPSWLESRH